MNGGRKHYKVKNDSINIIKMRIAVINLLIDTNIWLAMFHLSKDDLKEYIKQDSKAKEYFQKETDLEKSLERLENIQSIRLEDGLYHIVEIILN